MLQFLYSSDFNENEHTDEDGPLPTTVRVHAVADKYLLPELVTVAYHKFNKCLDELAKVRSARTINHTTSGFLHAIPALYEDDGNETQKSLRLLFITHVMSRGKTLLAWEPFQEMAKSVPAFATALVVSTFRLEKREELAQS